MKTLILTLCMGLLSVGAFAQKDDGNKMAAGGKVAKAAKAAPAPKASSQKARTAAPKRSNAAKRPAASARQADPDARYAASGYMEITGVSFANADKSLTVIDDYGSMLYASEVQYLCPRIFYRGLASEDQDITLKVKIFKEDGTLVSSANSPAGYTYSQDVTVEPGSGGIMTMSGWGNSTSGTYSPGQYKFQFYYNGNVLYEKTVRLYSGSRSVASNRYFRVSSISFANSDTKGNILSSYGSTLYDATLKYLKPKMTYVGLRSSNENVKLYFRVFYSSGKMASGSGSPNGYTYSDEVTIKPGTNTIELSGYGRESGGAYPAGVTRFECWIDGNKVYETTVNVAHQEGAASSLTVDGKTAVSTSFTYKGGTETFYVRTDASSWETWGVPSWCKVIRKDSGSFTLQCEANYGAARSDYMKVKAGGKEVRIDIKQD